MFRSKCSRTGPGPITARNRRFAADLAEATRHRFDLVVGFDKLSGLDLLYCADPAVAARSGWRRLTPRYRALRALEAACFAAGANTRVIALSPAQIEGYRRAWQTEPDRVALLPPNVERERRHPERRLDGTRERRRAALGLKDEDWCWLAIGRQPHTKGFDRAIAALPAFPTARLFVIGLGRSDPAAASLRRAARRLHVEDRLTLLGFVADEEIADVMAAADLLLHPARADTTGTVILEAIVNGLPVVTTAVCGYAGHVREADAGAVVAEPFARGRLLAALREASDKGRALQWSASAMRYGERPELYSGLEVAADLILRADV
jgi:UDP-glucose:(heptosyl)LPS alpha-1,3-glucosyltransferase